MSDRDPLQDLWLQQTPEEFSMSIEEIKIRSNRLQSTVAKRNAREYAVAAFLIVVFTIAAVFVPNPLSKLGLALSAAGVAVSMLQLFRLARAASLAEFAAAGDQWSDFYHMHLTRQRDALRRVWIWYLGPLIPGSIVYWIAAGSKHYNSGDMITAAAVTLTGLAFTALVFFWVAKANHDAANALQHEIDTIDRMTR